MLNGVGQHREKQLWHNFVIIEEDLILDENDNFDLVDTSNQIGDLIAATLKKIGDVLANYKDITKYFDNAKVIELPKKEEPYSNSKQT